MSPTITVAVFFSFFFFVRPQNVCVVDTFYRTTKSTVPASGITSELLQRAPPFVYSIFNVKYKTGRDHRVPPLIFFGTVRLFYEFFLSPKGPPFKFFDILRQTEVSKSSKGPPFLVFGTVRLSQNSHFLFFFRKIFSKKFRIFLMSQFFDILQQTGFSKSRKGPPFTSLKTKRFFEP